MENQEVANTIAQGQDLVPILILAVLCVLGGLIILSLPALSKKIMLYEGKWDRFASGLFMFIVASVPVTLISIMNNKNAKSDDIGTAIFLYVIILGILGIPFLFRLFRCNNYSFIKFFLAVPGKMFFSLIFAAFSLATLGCLQAVFKDYKKKGARHSDTIGTFIAMLLMGAIAFGIYKFMDSKTKPKKIKEDLLTDTE